MKLKTILAALAVGIAGAAFAQDQSLDGTWAVEFKNPGSASNSAEMIVTGDKGNWKPYSKLQAIYYPCEKIEKPVTLQRTGDKIKISVLGSQALAGCSDVNIFATRKPDGTMESEKLIFKKK